MLRAVCSRAAVHSRATVRKAGIDNSVAVYTLTPQASLEVAIGRMYSGNGLGRTIQGQRSCTSEASRQIHLPSVKPWHSWSCRDSSARRSLSSRSPAACAAFQRPQDLLLYGLPGASPKLLSSIPSAAARQAAAVGMVAQQQQPQQQAALQRVPLPGDLAAMREKLQFYNSMSRQKEQFKARQELDGKVQMYVCGVTVYDYSHIGEPWQRCTRTDVHTHAAWMRIQRDGRAGSHARGCAKGGAACADRTVTAKVFG